MQIVPFAALSLLASPLPTPTAQEDGRGPEVVTRIIDVSALHTVDRPVEITGGMRPVVPFVTSTMPAGYEPSQDGISFKEIETAAALSELFLAIKDGGIETMDAVPGQRILVEGPAANLDELEELVAKVESAIQARPRLEVIRFSAPPGIECGSVTKAELDAALASASDVRRYSVVTSGSGMQRLSDVETHTCVDTIQVEIAHASAATSVFARDVKTGMELTLASYVLGDRINLSYALMHSLRWDRPVWDGVVVDQRITGESGSVDINRSERWTERFRASGGVAVGSASLRDGEIVLFNHGTDAEFGLYCAIRVASLGADGGGISVVPIDDDRRLVAVPLSRVMRSSHFVQPINIGAVDSFERVPGSSEHEGGYLHALTHTHEETVFGMVRMQVDAIFEMVVGGYLMAVYTEEDAGVLLRAAQAEARSQPEHLNVRVQAVDHLGTSKRAGTFSIASGEAGAISSGLEGLVAESTNVEVAQFSSIREPKIVSHFQGLGLRVVASTTRDGRLAYQFQGQLSADLEEWLGAGSKLTESGLAAIRAGHLSIDEAGVAPASENGEWTFVLGDQSMAGAHVVVTISRAK